MKTGAVAGDVHAANSAVHGHADLAYDKGIIQREEYRAVLRIRYFSPTEELLVEWFVGL